MVIGEVSGFSYDFISLINKTASNMILSVAEQVPIEYRTFMVISFYTILIAIYAIFIWKFYKFLARRDIIHLNLNQYNRSF